MEALPKTFSRTIVNLYGAAGRAWLDRLPQVLRECEERWAISVERPFPALSINYVAPATHSDGTQLVLKLGVPNGELKTEIAALRLYDGQGSVRLIAAEPDHGAMLLERIEPGMSLATVEDDEDATAHAAEVMRQLWRPVPTPNPFPSVSRWAADLDDIPSAFGGGTGPFSAELVDTARSLFADLLPSMGPSVLLHGDFHHMNILSAKRQPWLAIDPKGVVGEREYEVGALVRNPVPHFLDVPNPARKLRRRLDRLAADLAFDRERLRCWSLAQAVLAAWWAYDEESEGWRTWMHCAEILAALK